MAIKRVLVTGAGGTVGDYVVDELLKKGYEVVAVDLLDKHLKKRYGGNPGNMIFVEGDLRDHDFVRNCVISTCPDAIVHTAALIDLSLPRETLLEVNCEAVMHLYSAFRTVGGKVFVHLSSGSIYKGGELRTEKAEFFPKSAYEESKILAEEFLARQAKENHRKTDPIVMILRPSLIYGPANKFLAANYLAIAIVLGEYAPGFLPYFLGGPRTNLVHAEDVARAAVFLMENKDTHQRGAANAFNVADDSPWGFGEQLEAIQAACGYRIIPIPFPLPSAKIVGLFKNIYVSPLFLRTFNQFLSTLWHFIILRYGLKNKFEPKISEGMTDYFGGNAIFSNTKIKQFGFELLYPNFRKGILPVVLWYRTRKWIP